MTTIIAVRDENQTVMIADRRGIADDVIVENNAEKILRLEKEDKVVLIGVIGNTKYFHTLKYDLSRDILSRYSPENAETFVRTILLSAIRRIFNENKYFNSDGEIEGSLLIATKDDIFRVSSELQMTRIERNFWAMGSGGEIAIGALAALENAGIMVTLPASKVGKAVMLVVSEFNPYTGSKPLIHKISREKGI